MNASEAGDDDELEQLVAGFLERREHEPALSPADYAAAHGARAAALVRAIEAACEAEAGLSAAADALPERIGPYRVRARLGHGGMGVVYAAERDGREVALKLLAPALAADPHARERIQREARGLARLAHPGIVRVLESGLHEGAPYLVMERVHGPTLAELALPLAPERAARIGLALARAVAAAHAEGILHRDLKPSNVILRADDEPVLLDFGLVTAADEGTLTSPGALLGTPRYMAPEQAAGLAAEERTDVHGLGLILFELLSGAPARAEGTREEVLAVARGGRVRALSAQVPRPLARLVRCALAREPRRRPASAAHLAQGLERFLAGESVRLAPPTALQELGDALRRHPRRALLGLLLAGSLALFARPALETLARERNARAGARLAEEARVALARGASDEAVGFALEAGARLGAAGGDASAELPRWLDLARPAPGVLAALERRGATADGQALLQFALAYAHDSEHRLPQAVRAYGRALELDPSLLRARLNLAHLFSGAQLGACDPCDEAYAEAPEMLDPARALEQLEHALRADRGASDWCVGRVVQTALTLGARRPECGARAAVAGLLEELLTSGAGAAAEGRMAEGLARLRGAGD